MSYLLVKLLGTLVGCGSANSCVPSPIKKSGQQKQVVNSANYAEEPHAPRTLRDMPALETCVPISTSTRITNGSSMARVTRSIICELNGQDGERVNQLASHEPAPRTSISSCFGGLLNQLVLSMHA